MTLYESLNWLTLYVGYLFGLRCYLIFNNQQYNNNTEEVLKSFNNQPINNVFVQYNPVNNFYHEPAEEKDLSDAGLVTPYGLTYGLTYDETDLLPPIIHRDKKQKISSLSRTRYQLPRKTNTKNVNNFLIPPVETRKLIIEPR